MDYHRASRYAGSNPHLGGLVAMKRTMIPILLLAACFAAGPALGQTSQDSKITRAREKMQAARQVLDDTEERLVEVYEHLEHEFDRISGMRSLSFNEGLGKSWTEAYEGIKSWWLDEKETTGKSISRRKFDERATPVLIEALTEEVLDIDVRLATPYLTKTLSLFFTLLRGDTLLEEEALENLFDKVLTPDMGFHAYWNDGLFETIEEARAFAKANEDFDKARTDLDRLERPERYSSRGLLAPPRMVHVPAGTYIIGPNTGWDRDRRRHSVREYYIDKYEVTNREFRDFLRSLDPREAEQLMPYFWPKNENLERYYPEDRADHPVTGVTWAAANAYAKWAGKRLPTEEEWEIAARGKERYAFPWGNAFDADLCNSRECRITTTLEVGSFPRGASPFGCLDMAGNASEWTSTDQDGNHIEEMDDKVRNMVIRGGDFREGADHARCDFRWMTPMDPYEGRNPSKKRIGFRCVKNVK